MSTVYFIYEGPSNCLGYVATFDEALKIVWGGSGKFSIVPVNINNIGSVKQTCFENIFNK